MLTSALYLGDIMHCRFQPRRHRFRYRVASLLLDLDELGTVARRLRSFSVDRWNLFSFHNRDHGARDGSSVKDWVTDGFARVGDDISGGRVLALCFPRTFGYVFNPLTVYWGYRADGNLAGVLYEVKNTFGDQHGYVVPAPRRRAPGSPLIQQADKSFHVSPFFPMDGHYRFRIDEPSAIDGDPLRILIRLQDQAGTDRLIATQTLRRAPLTDRSLIATLASHPWNTVKVISAIHVEALRLLAKGAAFHRRPSPPVNPISLGKDLSVDPATDGQAS